MKHGFIALTPGLAIVDWSSKKAVPCSNCRNHDTERCQSGEVSEDDQAEYDERPESPKNMDSHPGDQGFPRFLSVATPGAVGGRSREPRDEPSINPDAGGQVPNWLS